jgi:hypothetical protein
MAGSFSDGQSMGSIYANVTSDDKFLFVSEEAASAVTVIDLDHARSARFGAGSIIGKIPVGRAPIALTFSPDERAGLFPKNQSENRPPAASSRTTYAPEHSLHSARTWEAST